jgi:hypothetical protein
VQTKHVDVAIYLGKAPLAELGEQRRLEQDSVYRERSAESNQFFECIVNPFSISSTKDIIEYI